MQFITQEHDPATIWAAIATVHWLRHTGILEGVKHRLKEFERDDACHSSWAILDRYINIEF